MEWRGKCKNIYFLSKVLKVGRSLKHNIFINSQKIGIKKPQGLAAASFFLTYSYLAFLGPLRLRSVSVK